MSGGATELVAQHRIPGVTAGPRIADEKTAGVVHHERELIVVSMPSHAALSVTTGPERDIRALTSEHVHSPVGGQGVNIALRDALVAANHLCPVLTVSADQAAIDAAARRVRDERWIVLRGRAPW